MNTVSAVSSPGGIRLPELLALVLLWNSGYKGARVLNTLYALELGATPFDIGLLLATYGLFALVLAVYAGRLSDRYGVRMPVVGGIALTTAGMLLPYFWPSLATIFVSAAVSGTGFIFVQIGMQTLTGSLATGAQRTRNINTYALVVSTADLIGPVLAGFSIDNLGHVPTYLCLSALGFAALAGLGFLAGRLPHERVAATGKARRRMIDLVRLPNLKRVFIASAVVMTGLDLFQLYMPLYGHGIGLSASAIGLVLGAFAAAGFVTRALLPLMARRIGEEKTLTYSIAITAVTFLLVPLVENVYALGAICFALGLGMGLGQPLSVILTYNYAPPGRAGEAIGLRIAIHNSMHVVVPTAFGGLGSAVGLAPVFWVSSAVLGVGAYLTRKRGA